MSVALLALKGLWRRPLRTGAMLMGLASVSAMLFSLTTVYISISQGVKGAMSRLGADAVVVPYALGGGASEMLLSGYPAAIYMDAGLAEKAAQAEGVEAVSSQLFIVSADLPCCSVSDTALIGFEPERDFTITPWLRERLGRALKGGEVIVGGNILSEPGGKVEFYGSLFTIAGKLDPTGMGFIDGSVFMPMADARRMIAESARRAERPLDIRPDEISAVMLRFKGGVSHEKAAIMLEHSLPGQRVVLAADAARSVRAGMVAPLKAAFAAGLLQWAVSLAFIGVLFSLSASERRREFGILRAMGSTRRGLLRMLLAEALVLSSVGGAAGTIAGLAFIAALKGALSAFFGAPLEAQGTQTTALVALGALSFSLATGVGATLYTVLREARRPPFEAITGG